jgi:Ca-activated chloride channel family protein
MRRTCLPFAVSLLAVLVGAVLGIAASHPARAAEAPTLIIVFDGSGSMWGRIGNQRDSKLAMAREGVGQGLSRLAPATRVGLVSFGHRRGGDCQDTEVIVPPAPLDAERIMSPLERLNPRGRGPLTKALRETVAHLGPQTAPAHIVLVHDGADNCQEDPCSALGPLKAAHPGVRIDVVSVGAPPEEARTLACLPQATGGKQYLVSAAADIEAALVEALGNVPRAPPPAAPAAAAPALPPPARTPPASGRPGLQLWATLVKGGAPVAAPVTWRIRRSGEKGAPLWEGRTASPLLVLPTGTYDIEASIGLITRMATAEAVEGEARSLGLPLDAGLLVLAEAQPAQTKPAQTKPAQTMPPKTMLDDAIVTFTPIDASGTGKATILRHAEAELALPPGNYLVAVTSGAMRIERPVGIVAGERISIAAALTLGELELHAAAAKGGAALDGLVYTIFEDDPDVPQGRREVARSAASSPRFRLPAGTYYVVARRGTTEARDRVSVRTGEVERHTMKLEFGRADIVVRLPSGGRIESEGPIAHRLERVDVQPAEVLTASGISVSLEVPSGQYRLQSRMGLGNVQAHREFQLKPGAAEQIIIEHPAAGARFRMLERGGGRPVADVSFEVRDAGGRVVWAGLGLEPRVLLMAGRYTVRAEGGGQTLDRAFEIAPGEDRLISLSPS